MTPMSISAADLQAGDVISRKAWRGITATVKYVGFSKVFLEITDGDTTDEHVISVDGFVFLHYRPTS